MPRASEFVPGSDHHVVTTYDDGEVLLWDMRQTDQPVSHSQGDNHHYILTFYFIK